MTCPHCAARQERADLLIQAIHGHITDHEFDRRYNMLKPTTNKEGPAAEVKTCTRCDEVKQISEYSKNRRQSDGLQTWCKPCRAAYQAEWRARNLGRYSEYQAEWRAANADRVAEYRAEWRSRNKDHITEYQREYNATHKDQRAEYKAANRDRIAAQTRAYQDENPHVVWAANYRRRARRFGLAVNVEDFTKADVIEQYGDSCIYCDTGAFEHLDHYVSVKNGGPHTLNNVRPSCAACNLAKGDRQNYPVNTNKENDMSHPNHHTAPTFGDVGEEIEEWEVLPTHEPVETPVETPAEQPIPA